MELFFQYDRLRLHSFQAADNRQLIKIEENESLYLNFFSGVGYFNYCFLKENRRINPDNINTCKDFYSENGISRFKLILSNEQNNEQIIQYNGGTKTQTIVKTVYPLRLKQPDLNNSRLTFRLVNNKNIEHFTKTYLRAFEAENPYSEIILQNFISLSNQTGVSFYLPVISGKEIGVLALYKSCNSYFLAGGAILPGFRKMGYHLAGIDFRLQKVTAYPEVEEIMSWAYSGTDSLKNMLSCGLVVDKKYEVYEFEI